MWQVDDVTIAASTSGHPQILGLGTMHTLSRHNLQCTIPGIGRSMHALSSTKDQEISSRCCESVFLCFLFSLALLFHLYSKLCESWQGAWSKLKCYGIGLQCVKVVTGKITVCCISWTLPDADVAAASLATSWRARGGRKLKCSDIDIKHCQRHNGPEGWVHLIKVTTWGHITSSNINLDQIHLQNLD